jgi:hypothetical protein
MVLWGSLLDIRDEEVLKESIKSYASGHTRQSPVMSRFEFSRFVNLQTSILRTLASLIANSEGGTVQIEKNQFQHCTRMTCFILDILPTLRKICVKVISLDNAVCRRFFAYLTQHYF